MLQSVVDFVLGQPVWIVLPAGVILLLKGADWMVDGAVAIARQLGFSVLFIGLTIVAFGTSAPELAVNLIAAVDGNAELSFGNIVGSNLANIGLIIGLAAARASLPIHGRLVSKELPWLIVVSFGAIALAWWPVGPESPGGRGYTWIEGLIMLAAFAAFCLFWYRTARLEKTDPLSQEAEARAREVSGASMALAWVQFLVGLAALLVGGKLTEDGAVRIAEASNLSQAVIGIVIVAIATSLPELATVWIAVRKDHADLAVGNIVGSNVFNLLLVLPATALLCPVPLPADGLQDLVAMVVLTVMLLAFSITHGRIVTRGEGWALLVPYCAYFAWCLIREL